MSDNTSAVTQLNWARGHSLEAIALCEAACARDGVDRSVAIADERRNLASFDRQIAELAPKITAAKPSVKSSTES